ncbi:ferrous iron transport protein A [Halanaerobium praevalens]|uniref:FeoA family protein n=1 Tax=Halanaerobium praevalens (strain ATCC 33744 / DSM 2228 / GSL) TaxID=572479 RepID=E3DMD2_HALPG|nr:ferrous iron transport protein A [Halanaerobium praevalens]ADO76325.1 FeoA family protein [Halanaerobium praevalens DSM 2228]
MRENIIPLGLLPSGQKAKIVDNQSYGRGLLRRLEDLGLNIGTEIEVIAAGNPGPFLLAIQNQQVALGQNLAAKIMVKNKIY